MGYFKAVSKKQRIKKKIITYLIMLGLFLVLAKIVYRKFNISNEKMLKMVELYMGGNLKKSKEEIVFKENKPVQVYIYNTHQKEEYKNNSVNPYNINYTVMFASYALASYLEDYGIKSLVETSSISDFLNKNNMKYSQSYEASRILMEDAFLKNSSLRFFIDLHRDSSVYEKTTFKIENDSYAKILFVVGLEHNNYELNLKVASDINDLLVKVNPELSRGIMKKSGDGVNGIYNQDFNQNVILLELGGQYNTFEEVNNTLKILAKVLSQYLTEEI